MFYKMEESSYDQEWKKKNRYLCVDRNRLIAVVAVLSVVVLEKKDSKNA